MLPRLGTQGSGLPVSLSGQIRSLNPLLLLRARFPNPDSFFPKDPEDRVSIPLLPCSPGLLTRSGFCELPSAPWALSLLPLRRIGSWGRGRREAALSPSPAARKWRGVQQVRQLTREEGATSLPRPQPRHLAIPAPLAPPSENSASRPLLCLQRPHSCPLEGQVCLAYV